MIATLGHDGRPKGALLQPSQPDCDDRASRSRRPRRETMAVLPADGVVGDDHLSRERGAAAALLVTTATGSMRRDPARARPHGIVAAADLGELLTDVAGKGARRRASSGCSPLFRGSGTTARTERGDEAVPRPTGRVLALGEFVVYGPVRDRDGLRRARWALTGGAPLGPDTFRFFRSFGVNLKQIYGATELCGAGRAAARRRGRSELGRPRLPEIGIDAAARCWCVARHVQRLLQAGRGDPRHRHARTAGCGPATPASSIRAATS